MDLNSPEVLDVPVETEDEGRYSRLELIPWWDQTKLRGATVLVAGAGALGNEILKNLVLLGVGRILLADMDRIESSNLSRSVFFRAGDEGRYKAEVAAERARDLNPDTQIIPLVGDLTVDVGLGVFRDVTAVVGGLDNREARLFINQSCWKVGTPWIDGAIEALQGVARVFVPGKGACYECTMSEVDYQLINARKSCALLTREEAAHGRIPTTPTVSSVIAGIEVQEFVKLIHAERGLPNLAGRGYVFNGLTHDSYVVEYTELPDCLSHDSYESIEELSGSAESMTVAEALSWAEDRLDAGAVVELERELITGLTCQTCKESEAVVSPLGRMTEQQARCPACGALRTLDLTHSLDRRSALQDCSLLDVGVPRYEVLTARQGLRRVHALLVGDREEVFPPSPAATLRLAEGR